MESEISDQEKEEVTPSSPALCEIAPERDGIALLEAFSEETAQRNAPRWFQDHLDESKCLLPLASGQPPAKAPGESGHLYYTINLDGCVTEALLDHGATHSFVLQPWAARSQLPISPLKNMTALSFFAGPTRMAVTHVYRAKRVSVAKREVPFTFLVIPNAPADVVLGLDFIRRQRLLYDPISDYIFSLPRTVRRSIDPERAPLALGEGETERDAQLRSQDTPCLPKLFAAGPNVTAGLDANEQPETTMITVTGDTPEEVEQLEKFRASLPTDLLAVIDRNALLFSPPNREPPERLVKHEIRLLPDAVPVKRRAYPLSPPKLLEMNKQMEALVKNGWVEPSNSPWAAPILFVPKKGGAQRMCDDYRDLNAVTVDDSYPLPRIEVLLHRASSATVFSKLDLASGFHQIEVESASRPLTAFRLPEPVCGSSLWQWKVMPFGLRNAPATFQRAMAAALDGCEHCSVVYIDDILIFSTSEHEHLEHLECVFQKLLAHSYRARLMKCAFMQEEVEFLGHKLAKGGILAHPDKVKAVLQWPMPLTSIAQVRSFLGLVMWYRAFIPHLATIAAPLFDLTSPKRKFEWTEECAEAMRYLQHLLIEAPVLARWEWNLPTRLCSDASKVGLGAVLEQQHGEEWRPIAYWSRKLRDAETRYSATDLEWMAAVVPVTRVWYWLLESTPFTIRSDHKALERKLCKSCHDPPINDRQARWIESMAKFPYSFQWEKGSANKVADALSRSPAELNVVTVVYSLLAGLWQRLRLAVQDDTEYQRLLAQAQDAGSALSTWHGLVVDARGRVFVPQNDELRTIILVENHTTPLAGHFGAEKTQEMTERYWQWKGLARDVREYVRSCAVCQRNKHSTRAPAGALHPILARRPWQIVTLDFVSGLHPAVKTKNTQILVLVDKFSKYVCLESCAKEIDALETAQIFLRRVVRDFGVPQVVISDRGPQFSSEIWKRLLELMGSRVALATTHHPQSDGQSERMIQTLLRVLRSYAQTAADQWEILLPMMQFALNNAPAASGKYSPFQVLFGISPVQPTDLLVDDPDDRPGAWEWGDSRGALPWVRKWWKARRRVHDFIRHKLRETADLVQRRYDKSHRPLLLEEGDLVLLSVKSYDPRAQTRKHRSRYTGPYVVDRKVHDNAYRLSGLPPDVPPTQNVQFLRLFVPTPAKFSTRPDAQFACPVARGDHLEWEVEKIEAHRTTQRGLQYLVSWKGTPDKSWLQPRQLKHCQRLLHDYQRDNAISLDVWSDSASSLESDSSLEEEDESSSDSDTSTSHQRNNN